MLSLGSAGAAPAATGGAAAAGGAAPAEEKVEEKEEEKEESDEDVLSSLTCIADLFRWVSVCLIRVVSHLTRYGGLNCDYSTS
jgi:hypothetical protein